jgi:hypothetical protein
MEVLRQEANIGDIAAIGFSATEKNNWFTRDDPLGDLVERHGEQVGDGSIEEVAVGGKDIVFILIEINEITFKLFESFLALNRFFGAVALAIPNRPQGVAFR